MKCIKSDIDAFVGINIILTQVSFSSIEVLIAAKIELLILLLMARKRTRVQWMNLLPTRVSQWKQRLAEVNVMEALTA